MTQEDKNRFAEEVAEFIRNSDDLECSFNAEVFPAGSVSGWGTFVQGNKMLTLTALIKKVI